MIKHFITTSDLLFDRASIWPIRTADLASVFSAGITPLNITPLYEFGYGVSYTNFSLSPNITITVLSNTVTALPKEQPVRPGGNSDLYTPLIYVTAKEQNTGNVTGAAIPQLYAAIPH